MPRRLKAERYARKKPRRLGKSSSSSSHSWTSSCFTVNTGPSTTPVKQYSSSRLSNPNRVTVIRMETQNDEIDIDLEVKMEEEEDVKPEIDQDGLLQPSNFYVEEVETELVAFPQLVTMTADQYSTELEAEEPIPFSGLDVDPLEQNLNVDVGVDQGSSPDLGIIKKEGLLWKSVTLTPSSPLLAPSTSTAETEKPCLKEDRVLPGTEAICHHCGTLSRILNRCEYCGVLLPEGTTKFVDPSVSRLQPQPRKVVEPEVRIPQWPDLRKDDPRIRCRDCGLDLHYFSPYQRAQHRKVHKPARAPAQCKDCGVIIKSGVAGLRRHQQRHCWGKGDNFQPAQIDYGRLIK